MKVIMRHHHQSNKNTWNIIIWSETIQSGPHLIVNMIETQDTDGVDILLSPAWAPPPVITGGNSENIYSIPLIQLWENCGISDELTNSCSSLPWKRVAHWILDPWHPLLLLWKKVILPNLKLKILRKISDEYQQSLIKEYTYLLL